MKLGSKHHFQFSPFYVRLRKYFIGHLKILWVFILLYGQRPRISDFSLGIILDAEKERPNRYLSVVQELDSSEKMYLIY